jgi:hypothetical protein
MRVKELKKLLDGLDEDLEVFGYSYLEEGGGDICNAKAATEFPHCGGDKPANLPTTFALLTFD